MAEVERTRVIYHHAILVTYSTHIRECHLQKEAKKKNKIKKIKK